ncbi:T9SS sorting signal type C domain-containing protein [Flavobacterium faecale]|uniref:Ig-like domain-containing protein n=1 Tax=Flavobacterium faecale TaxID=1355330 RepID=UPI003AAF2F5C
MRQIFTWNTFILFLFFLFFSFVGFSQSVGDYQSTGNGNWTTLSSWQRFNGTSWVTPSGTSPQGYPGQFSGTGAVLIQSGHKITLNMATIPTSFGQFTISGQLVLVDDTTHIINTTSLIVTSSLGSIDFNKKSDIKLPAGTPIQVSTGGLIGDCSNNNSLFIGSVEVAVCKGGNSDTGYDFDDIMDNGGTLYSTPSSNSPVCSGNAINLYGSYTGLVGKTTSGGSTNGVKYSWSVTAPNSATTTYTSQNPSFSASQTGNYSATLTCTTYFGTTAFSHSKTITIVVNAIPTVTGTAPNTRCGTGTVSLGATASAGTLNWYAASTGGAILGTGTSFTTPSITSTTTYYVDATNNGCTTATRTPVTATVNAIPTITGTTPNTRCGTGTVSLGATASAGTLNWYAASTGGVILGTGTSFTTPSITSTTTYYVDATNNGCTTATRTPVTATVNAIPTVTGTTPNTRCGTGTVSLGATASVGTLNWYAASTGGVILGTGTSFTTPSITSTTTYYVDATNNGCTTATRTPVTATVNAIPTVTGTTPNTRCGTGTVSLGATASAGTLNWYAASTGGAILGTGTSFTTPSITSTTTYYVDATNNGCTTATRTPVTATVNAIPTVTGTTPNTRCGTGTVSLGATTSVGTLNWYAASTGGVILGTGTSFTTPSITSTTTYYVDATNNGCTTATRTPVTATVNAIPTVTGTTPNTRCGTGTVSLGATASVGTLNWYAASTGGAILGTGTSFTTPSITSTTTYYVDATNNGCTTATRTPVTASVTLLPSIPTISSTTEPTCSLPTGSIALSNLPSGNWTLYQYGEVTNTITGSGSTATVSGLAVGNYTFTVNNGTCTSGSSASVTINNAPIITNTWTGSWDNGTPTLDQKIVFAEDYNEDTNVKGCSCKVTPNKNVIIKTGRIMQIVNDVEVMGTGSLTFENHASLVQINDNAINSGNITYNRTTASILKTDYTYWSSPVENFTLGGIKAGTLYYMFNAAGNSWTRAYASTIMTPGNGYIVRGEGTGFNSGSVVVNAPFFGKPNNGIISTPIVGSNASNLIGNPYPSAIDADAFLFANNSVLEGTLYFWTHGTAIQLASNLPTGTAGSGKYAYTSDDYATYNYTGGTSGVNGVIGAGQGFMATGLSGGSATFTNSMRIGPAGELLNNSFFFKPASNSKTAKTATTSKIEKNRVWLNMTNTQGAFKQALIGYITGATNNYDRGYDGISYDGNSFIDFYSINQNTPLTIQGRALPFQDSDVVPLGYSTTIAGEFTIAIDKTDGSLNNQNIYLEDKTTNTIQNLKEKPYTFTTTKGTFNNRFLLTYKTQNTLGTEDIEIINNAVYISQKENEIKINVTTDVIDEVSVFDISGKLILQKSKVDSPELLITNMATSEQMLLVKIKLNNGQIINKKILY